MRDERLAELRRVTEDALDMCLRWQRADFTPNAVGSAARTALGQAATAFVLGLEEEAWPVLHRAREWLVDSAERVEQMGNDPCYFAMLRAQALGLAAWLLQEDDAPRHLYAAVALHQRTLAGRRIGSADLVEMHLPDLVRDAVLAGRADLGARAHQRFVGAAPSEHGEVGSPLELAGWLADELTRFHPPPAWVSVGERVLGQRLLDWLDRGHGVTASLWLWLVYFGGGAALTPLEAMRRGGELVGARRADPLAQVLRQSLGEPVDLDLFRGFLSVVAGSALPTGSRLTVEFIGLPPLTVVAEHPYVTTTLDSAVRAALPASTVPLEDRLAAAARGRLVAPDGQTPVRLERVRVR